MIIAEPKSYDNSKKFITRKIKDFDKISYTLSINDPKDMVQFIKKVERFVRGSMEYKDYIRFLRDEIDMTKCSFFTNISTEGRKKVRIEIHHEPFNLFDITMIVTNKWLASGKPLNHLDVAEEVMKLHYQGKVGLIPISKTVHQLVHSGELFIPIQNVYGNFIKFLQEFNEHISDDLHDILKSKLELSKDTEHDTSVLETKYTYLEVDGMKFPSPVQV